MGPWLAVAFGGALGAMLRFAVTTVMLPVVPGKLPWSTLLVNVAGSFIMGALFVIIVEKGLWSQAWSQHWRLILMTGFLGALTTFSTFSLESVALLQRGQLGLAATYVGLSVVGSITACLLGLWLANRVL